MLMNTIAMTLIEATLTLYPADATDAPITDQPIWSGVEANNLEIAEHWVKVRNTPTGVRVPRNHPLVAQYQIGIERVWALPLGDLLGFKPVKNRYVLDILWTDEESGDWHRETFYGVTISERTRRSKEVDGGFVENQQFEAEDVKQDSGRGTPPPLPTAPLYTVKYIDTDNRVTSLYTYDASTRAFTEATSGVTAGKATIVQDDTSFRVQFAGASWPALEILPSGELHAAQLKTGTAEASDLPRLEFYCGSSRYLTVDRWGEVFARSFFESPSILSALPSFQVAFTSIVCQINQDVLQAGSFVTFSPSQVSGLKLWCSAESLTGLSEGLLSRWPDQSGNGNDLLQAVAGVKPTLLRKPPLADSLTGAALPQDGEALVLFTEDTANPPQGKSMGTAGNMLESGDWTVFVVAWPVVKPESTGTYVDTYPRTLLQRAPGDWTADFLSLDYAKLVVPTGQPARYGLQGWYYGSSTSEDKAEVPMTPQQWNVFEMTVNSSVLETAVNGAASLSTALSNARAMSKPIEIGASDPALGNLSCLGYIRAVLIYEGVLSGDDKWKIRRYLAQFYATGVELAAPVLTGGEGGERIGFIRWDWAGADPVNWRVDISESWNEAGPWTQKALVAGSERSYLDVGLYRVTGVDAAGNPVTGTSNFVGAGPAP